MTRVIVIGAKGKMGRRIMELVESAPDMSLAAGVDVGDSLNDALKDSDVAIDFTTARAAAENAKIAARHGVPIVIGTTGLGSDEEDALRSIAASLPIVYAPNMSIGVNVMFEIIRLAARALGPGFTAAIEETHHVHKLDRPSGTAKRMAKIVERETGGRSAEVESIRKGEVVGDHTIRFTGPGEDLAINHNAKDRGIFAQGAIAAARWIVGKPAGLYDMVDVLGLKG